jgi:hypothetical protein
MDTITIDLAGEIDAQWTNSGMPDDGLRIYGLRRTGNKQHTFLGVPGTNGHNPTYVLSNGRYLHVTGPTLADWQQEQEARQERQDAADLYARAQSDEVKQGLVANTDAVVARGAFGIPTTKDVGS